MNPADGWTPLERDDAERSRRIREYEDAELARIPLVPVIWPAPWGPVKSMGEKT